MPAENRDNDPQPGAQASGDQVNLTTHPLVARLYPDPNQPPPKLATLVGYLGPSRSPDNVRLYLDLSFQRYYDIPTSGIVGTSPVTADDPNSPTTVQVDSATRLDATTITTQSIEAGLLSGSITGGYLAGALGSAGQALPGTCKDVLWTAGCTFAPALGQAPGRQALLGDCQDVLWTAGCTFGGTCGQVLTTVACTVGAAGVAARQAQALPAGCQNVLWTAGCTFGGTCGQVLTTLACTVGAAGVAARQAQALPGTCENVLWTAGCTFTPAQAQGLAAAAQAQPGTCGNVLTTLACTLVAAGAAQQNAFCGTVLWTAAPGAP